MGEILGVELLSRNGNFEKSPPAVCEISKCSRSFKYLLLSVLLIIVILVAPKWHLHMVLMCVSLVTHDTEYCFMCLLASHGEISIHILSSLKRLSCHLYY